MISVPAISVKYNWQKKSNKDGSYLVHICISLPGERPRFYPVELPAKLHAEQWTGADNHWVKDDHPFFFEINCRIAETIHKLNELIKRYYVQHKPVTFYAIEKELLMRGERNIFNEYFRNYISSPPEIVKLDAVTWEKYRACLTHLDNFQSKIFFAEIDETLIARFKNYMTDLKGRKEKMAPATIKSYFDKLKVVLKHAAKKDRFLDPRDVESYFEEIKISIPNKREGQHLEIEEIRKLKAFVFDKKDKSLKRDRDIFLFQVYTGFYYKDLQTLRKDQLYNDIEQGHYIIGRRSKNGNPTIIPLFKFPYAAKIMVCSGITIQKMSCFSEMTHLSKYRPTTET